MEVFGLVLLSTLLISIIISFLNPGNSISDQKKFIKGSGVALLTFFLISIIISLLNPPGISISDQKKIEKGYFGFNSDYSEPYRFDPNNHPEMQEIFSRLPETNFDKEFDDIPAFFALYSNTILTWFANPRYLQHHYYIPSDDGYFIKLGSIMPYIIVVSLIFVFFYLVSLDK